MKTCKAAIVGTGRRVKQVGAVVAFLWILSIFTGYYAVHKPVTSQDITALQNVVDLLLGSWGVSGMGSSLWAITIAVWTLLSAFSVGKVLLENLFPACVNSPWDYWTFGTPLGLGVLSITIFVLGMAGLLYAWLWVGILLVTTVMFIRPSTLAHLNAGTFSVARVAGTWTRWDHLLIGFIALSIPIALLSALAPPTAWDALVYHLLQAELYIDSHRIVSGVDITHIYFPPLMEMLFTGGMLLGSDIAPALFSLIFYCLMLAALYRYSGTVFSNSYRWISLALFVASPSLVYLAGKPYVEWGLILYLFLAFWQMERWSSERNGGHLALSAVFTGLAMGVKYTAAPLVLALGILCLWHSKRMNGAGPDQKTAVASKIGVPVNRALPEVLEACSERRPEARPEPGRRAVEGLSRRDTARTFYSRDLATGREPQGTGYAGLFSFFRGAGDSSPHIRLPQFLAPVAKWSCLAIVVASPWYIKNLLFTGNPVYPFIFGGWNWDSWRAEWFSRPGTGLMLEPFRLAALPWEMTVLGQEGSVYYDATIGLLYLALLPLVLLVGLHGRAKTWAFIAAIGYAAWAFGAANSSLLIQTRLVYPVFPFLALIGTHALIGLRSWQYGPFDLGWVVRCLVGLALTLTALGYMVRLVSHPSLSYLAGEQSKEAYLTDNLGGYYLAMDKVKASLPAGAKLLMLWEPRGYFCPVECQPDSLLYNWRYALYTQGSIEAVLERWSEEGYSHVLINNSGVAYFSSPPHKELEAEHIFALAEIEKKGLDKLWGEGLSSVSGGESDVAEGYGYTIYKLRY